MASMVVCDGCEAVIRGPVAALRVRKGSERGLGAYLSLAYSGGIKTRKMLLNGSKTTARPSFLKGPRWCIPARKRPKFRVNFLLQSVA